MHIECTITILFYSALIHESNKRSNNCKLVAISGEIPSKGRHIVGTMVLILWDMTR